MSAPIILCSKCQGKIRLWIDNFEVDQSTGKTLCTDCMLINFDGYALFDIFPSNEEKK